MKRLNLTLATATENVALDEALLDAAEEAGQPHEVLRIWESGEPMVVAGRSTRVESEIVVPTCRELGIPIIRRTSGGATIVAGPGCLMYAVVLSYQRHPELRDIGQAHCFVLTRLANALSLQDAAIRQAGSSDLVVAGLCEGNTSSTPCAAATTVTRGTQGASAHAIESRVALQPWRKFSGNSMRAKRNHFLYHGTLLYDFDLSLIARCLRMPPRQPDYRQARHHNDFVTNLPLTKAQLVESLAAAWPTTGEMDNPPLSRVRELVATKFSQETWNLRYPA